MIDVWLEPVLYTVVIDGAINTKRDWMVGDVVIFWEHFDLPHLTIHSSGSRHFKVTLKGKRHAQVGLAVTAALYALFDRRR